MRALHVSVLRSLLGFCLLGVIGLDLGCNKGTEAGSSETKASDAGVGADAGPEAGSGAGEAPAVVENPELAKAMTEHFVHAVQLEQAVIDGDLDAVGSHARWLVDELPKQTFPEAWQPQLARMQEAARAASEAENLAQAAAAAGRLVETCGSCHAAIGRGPKFADAPAVPAGDDTHSRMLRHQWAAQRMREGMIGASDERWRLGAGAVSQAPPEPCPIPDAEVLDAETLKLREKIYELGAKALATEGAEQRAAVYGEYLSTCAGCHVGGC
ncbi:MAG: hypothetical protein KC457_21430 [Myxococcales bacterium]|nr:hypothetical protein [Myxococcales bacterium]